MKLLYSIFILSLCLILHAGQIVAQSAQISFDEIDTAEVDSIFADYTTETPGCAVGVTHQGGLIFSKGYGMANLDYGIPIQPDSKFMIASISKQFTAASILMMEQEGLIDLDENLKTYIPELPDFETPITARQMLHHTSGLRDLFSLLALNDVGLDNTTTPEATFDLISRVSKLNFEPNTEYNYSNSAYFLMSILVENLTEMTLREYADKHFFQPIGMTDTHFHDDTGMIVKNRAESYRPTDNGVGRFYRDNLDRVGARGLFTTIEDFAKWDANFLENKSNLENFREKMLKVGVFKDGTEMDYAAGIRLSEYRKLDTFGHGGNYMGFRSGYMHFPDYELGVIVFCNRSNISPADHVREVSDLYLKEVFEEKFSEYTGSYHNNGFRTEYDIVIEDGMLFLTRGLREKAELSWSENDEFRVDGLTVTFVRSGDEIEAMKLKSSRTANVTFERKN
ncbi:serine hydrolase domain-containing protein [Rhodohalobacter sp.]|uniref:serine hydrolase domain-containing protein n=1 Tax=Rhodohalobacter sp. TaxID=1974210 RepID=UPI002ACD5CF8|nr:serine hydrolase domain-containing protein [Rhodohalobacter sp.]MDZ7757049.1 serine hydrolase domain-containing protein [Rhodohalobacter sp.]